MPSALTLRVACQMDPIDHIDIRSDSTFALLLEAQKRGAELVYYTPSNLALLDDWFRVSALRLAVLALQADCCMAMKNRR